VVVSPPLSRATRRAPISGASRVAASLRPPSGKGLLSSQAPARGGHTPSLLLDLEFSQSRVRSAATHRGPQSGETVAEHRRKPQNRGPPGRPACADNLMIPAWPGRSGLHVWLAVAVAVPRRASRQRPGPGEEGKRQMHCTSCPKSPTAGIAMATRGGHTRMRARTAVSAPAGLIPSHAAAAM
jgi:hypothetical protein